MSERTNFRSKKVQNLKERMQINRFQDYKSTKSFTSIQKLAIEVKIKGNNTFNNFMAAGY